MTDRRCSTFVLLDVDLQFVGMLPKAKLSTVGSGLQDSCTPDIAMLGCHLDSALSRLNNAISHFDVLRVNLVYTFQSAILSTSWVT